ncbi:hypothetical protein GCM10010919_19040 [Alishewanella longhuensis]|uniref:Uncharacterized protein n=1 Tax=Alishewanella longhuensis TaxID=1091037 RepID=A0ABQ3KYG3_9ALTE|nr:CDP-glycerol glycerophosphotransferase family protein [Alishewanella longhuensis]GHG69245.1 hypothetical protein GCM10010919_19040 [Alishewanella longhuensis]
MLIKELNKICYVAPANPAGRQLLAQLNIEGIMTRGIVDNLKSDPGIACLDIPLKDDCIIIVASGVAQFNIAMGLMNRGVKSKQIFLQIEKTLQVKPYRPLSIYFKNCYFKFKCLLVNCGMKFFTTKYVVYYAENFIDTNLLLQFLAHQREKDDEAILICRKMTRQPALEKKLGYMIEKHTILAFYYLCRARVIVIDHEYTSDLFRLIRTSRAVVQLWHGLPYKLISGNKHYISKPDEVFISSSAWYNDNIFNRLFLAENFRDFGYARNDIFLQSADKDELINAVSLKKLKDTIDSTGQLWVYMPTYRDNESSINLDLSRLNVLCDKYNRSLILKLHPFVLRVLASQFDFTEDDEELVIFNPFSNIYLYPSGMNIYPWLAQSEVLITDFSSVATDYLLHDRPIFYYQYDKDEYFDVRGSFLVNDDYYYAGPVATDFEMLLQLLEDYAKNGDHWQAARSMLKQRLGLTEQLATPAIYQQIKSLAE